MPNEQKMTVGVKQTGVFICWAIFQLWQKGILPERFAEKWFTSIFNNSVYVSKENR